MKLGLRIALIAVGIVSLVPASSATAEGTSIAGAPTVTYDQQMFGNTLNGRKTEGGCTSHPDDGNYDSFWLLAVISGDALTIDWEAQNLGTQFWLLPAGTTDFTVDQTSNVVTGNLNQNNKGEVLYAAPSTGNMIVQIHNRNYCGHDEDSPGPYDFTASVRHAVVLALPHVSSLRRTGTLNVQVHNPDGQPITDASLRVAVEVRIGSHHMRIGGAAPSNGVASVAYAVPRFYRHKRASIRAVATGASYLTKHSSSLKVTTR